MHQLSPGPLETMGLALCFPHLSPDLANINAWKNMFDPYIVTMLQIVANLHDNNYCHVNQKWQWHNILFTIVK